MLLNISLLKLHILNCRNPAYGVEHGVYNGYTEVYEIIFIERQKEFSGGMKIDERLKFQRLSLGSQCKNPLGW